MVEDKEKYKNQNRNKKYSNKHHIEIKKLTNKTNQMDIYQTSNYNMNNNNNNNNNQHKQRENINNNNNNNEEQKDVDYFDRIHDSDNESDELSFFVYFFVI